MKETTTRAMSTHREPFSVVRRIEMSDGIVVEDRTNISTTWGSIDFATGYTPALVEALKEVS